MPPVGFEPTIPASQRPQTHALDRAATGASCVLYCILLYLCIVSFLESRYGLYTEFDMFNVTRTMWIEYIECNVIELNYCYY